MIELECFFDGENGTVEVYQLIRFAVGEPWRVVLDGELLGSVEKMQGNWRQLSGAELKAGIFNGLTRHIDDQYFNRLPEELCLRWPNQIEKVLATSDEEYLVICKAAVSFKSFEGIFSRFVPGMLKDEWIVKFRVFNHDFSDDFLLEAKPRCRGKESYGWEEVSR